MSDKKRMTAKRRDELVQFAYSLIDRREGRLLVECLSEIEHSWEDIRLLGMELTNEQNRRKGLPGEFKEP